MTTEEIQTVLRLGRPAIFILSSCRFIGDGDHAFTVSFLDHDLILVSRSDDIGARIDTIVKASEVIAITLERVVK